VGSKNVLVVGGGIAGLTVALALGRRGHRAEVVEISPQWQALGWGLSLTGPTLRALDSLGLADECIAAGFGISEIGNCDSAGQLHSTIELPRLIGPGRPALAGMARPVLLDLLRRRAQQAGAALRLGVSVTAVQQQPAGVTVTFTSGATGRYDVLVGADGVRSAIRRLAGVTDQPRFTGQVVWRALVRRPVWATSLLTFAGTDGGAGLIPISADRAYVFLTENRAQPDELPEPRLAARMRELLAPFSGPIGAVRDAITDPASVVRRPVLALIVPRPWHRGNTVLIGDAVHSPSPQLVSGAALAVEDAVLLAGLLDEGDVPAALAEFGDRRYDRCAFVVEQSVQIGVLERAGRHHEAHVLQDKCHATLAAPI
jgi:2-polyprenyl-6-methoxyphenol hydroxylase-like FAD-dependent oxidoreductase